MLNASFRRSFAVLLASVALTFSANLASAAPPWQRVSFGDGVAARVTGAPPSRYDFPLYANHDLKGDLSRITQLIVVMHGLQRNGDEYFDAAAALLAASGTDTARTLLIAPNFPGLPDAAKGFSGMPVWTVQGWIGGEDAVAFSPTVSATGLPSSEPAQEANLTRLSSLQVLDDILLRFSAKSRLPALKRVVVAGHSGGGQIVHRYAALNNVYEALQAQGLQVQTVVANPSSYLYFDDTRPVGDGSFTNRVTTDCPTYNRFKFGTEQLPAYVQGPNRAPADLFKRFAARDVAYLLGAQDNDPNHRVLDKSCGAMLQGPHRLARGRSYVAHERALFAVMSATLDARPPLGVPAAVIAAGNSPNSTANKAKSAVLNRQTFTVKDTGHDQALIFGSRCGARLLFGEGASANRGVVCEPF